jgi:hypothetical protein
MSLAQVVDTIRDAFSQRGAKVAEYTAMLGRHASAAAEDERAIAAKQAKVDVIDTPRRELEQAKAQAASARSREDRERAAVEGELRATPGRDVERFKARVDRLFERVRNPKLGDRPQAETETNSVTGAQRTTNLPALQKWLDLGTLLVRLNVEIRDELWRLDDVAQRARLAELRKELDDALTGTALELEA